MIFFRIFHAATIAGLAARTPGSGGTSPAIGSGCSSSGYVEGFVPVDASSVFQLEVVPGDANAYQRMLKEGSTYYVAQELAQELQQESPTNKCKTRTDYTVNPWIRSSDREQSYFQIRNDTLFEGFGNPASNLTCGLIWEDWHGKSRVPSCPAMPALVDKYKMEWKAKAKCINTKEVIVLLPWVVDEKQPLNWLIVDNHVPGENYSARIHYGSLSEAKKKELGEKLSSPLPQIPDVDE
jgi:hypothetical protein